MNLNQLKVFREIMNTGSLSQAARNLHRTQPAVSANLKSLEDELGMELFARQGRRLLPVPEAHYLLVEALEILDRVHATQQNLTSMKDKVKGSLRVIAMPGPSSYLLPQFVSDFIADSDEIRVTLTTRSSPQIRNLVATQNFDIGFCDIGPKVPTDSLYRSETIRCECFCALPASDPLAQKDTINALDLDNKPLGVLQPEHPTHSLTKEAFNQMGSRFNVRFDAQYFLPLFQFIEAGQAYSIVDAMSCESYIRSRGKDAKIVFRPFEPLIEHGYSVLSPKHRPLSGLAVQFVDAWREEVKTILSSHSQSEAPVEFRQG